MYVAKQFIASVTDDLQIDFRCARCGHVARADVIVTGHGVAEAPYLVGQADARARAAGDAAAALRPAAAQAAGLAGCPRCGEPDRAAVRWAAISAALGALASWFGVLATVIALFVALIGYAASDLLVKAGCFAGAALLVGAPAWLLGRSRFRKIKREADAAVTWKPEGGPP